MSDEKISVACPKVLTKRFKECCKANDTTLSREIRFFMRSYIAKHAQGDLFDYKKDVQ